MGSLDHSDEERRVFAMKSREAAAQPVPPRMSAEHSTNGESEIPQVDPQTDNSIADSEEIAAYRRQRNIGWDCGRQA